MRRRQLRFLWGNGLLLALLTSACTLAYGDLSTSRAAQPALLTGTVPKWSLQEITERLPGRVEPADVATLAPLLHETSEHHDRFEKAAPAHNWWDWYAPYFAARQNGSTSEQATEAADRYMAEVHGVVASR